MSNQQAYPLSWPPAWKRETFRRSSAFGRRSVESACTEIYRQLQMLGVGDFNVVISTNIALRRDGMPYSNQPQPSDPGAAVYFKLKNRPCVLACDKWCKIEENLWAIAKDIEALRGQERWGVGSVEQAFAGYTALPPVGTSAGGSWWDVLGTAHDAPFEAVQDAYRSKAMIAHPDRPGGSNEAMAVLNHAWDQARKAFNR